MRGRAYLAPFPWISQLVLVIENPRQSIEVGYYDTESKLNTTNLHLPWGQERASCIQEFKILTNRARQNDMPVRTVREGKAVW